jgi:hypothetical protein
MSLRYKI